MGNKNKRKRRKNAQQRRVQQKKAINTTKEKHSGASIKHNNNSGTDKEIKNRINKQYGTDYISLKQKPAEKGMEIKHHTHQKKQNKRKKTNKIPRLLNKWKNAFILTSIVMLIFIVAFAIFMLFVVPTFKHETVIEEPPLKKGITYLQIYDGQEIFVWKDGLLEQNGQKAEMGIKDDRDIFQCLVDDVIPDLNQSYSDDVQHHQWYIIMERDGEMKTAYGDENKPMYLKSLTKNMQKYFSVAPE